MERGFRTGETVRSPSIKNSWVTYNILAYCLHGIKIQVVEIFGESIDLDHLSQHRALGGVVGIA
jgi:hypothetical protein